MEEATSIGLWTGCNKLIKPLNKHNNGNRIVNKSNPNEVIDIAQCRKDDGAEVCCWGYNGGCNQHWAVDWCKEWCQLDLLSDVNL